MRKRQKPPPPAVPPRVPRASDLVVAPYEDRWTVGPFGSRAQVSFPTRQAALAHARAFASGRALDVWLTSDGVAFTRDAASASGEGRRGTCEGL